MTGNGGSIHDRDELLVTIKGSKTLHMRLQVEKVRHLINPPGQWIAVAKGPVFDELAIHQWKVNCDSCGVVLDFEFMVDAKAGVAAQKPAASARIAELGWKSEGEKHFCKKCQEKAA